MQELWTGAQSAAASGWGALQPWLLAIDRYAAAILALAALVAAVATLRAAHAQTRIAQRRDREAAAHRAVSLASEARLRWIEALRDDLAEYLALRTTQKDRWAMPYRTEQDIRAAMLRARIEFRLDGARRRHKELIDALDDVDEKRGAEHAMVLARDLLEAEEARPTPGAKP